MTDIRTQLPECPLEYEVPPIPGNHTALVIEITAADIDAQAQLLPWTLAGLINNTDVVMQGVHLYIACEDSTQDRIQTALKRFDLPHAAILTKDDTPFLTFGEFGLRYDSVCVFNIHYWAFRGPGNQDKLPLGHVLRHNYGWGVADYSLHPANGIQCKSGWIPTQHLQLTHPDAPASRQNLANYFMDAGERARWLHDANRAVYGERYEKTGKNVAAYFFNENAREPNWHLDASLLQYPSLHITEHTLEWFEAWAHLGNPDALVALWLLKTRQHAYNLRDSLMIEKRVHGIGDPKPIPYPYLCDMRQCPPDAYRHALKQLMGAQLAITV